MSVAPNKLMIFERKKKPLDNFGTGADQYDEVCKEYVSLEPLSGRELINAQQVQAQTTHKLRLHYSPGTSKVTPRDRAKWKKPEPVDTSDLNADCNYRIFNIESVINVREQNRELEMMVVEVV